MKTIDVAGAAAKQFIRLAERYNVILRTPDGREFILAEIDDFDREIELMRGNKSLMRLLKKRSAEQARHTSADLRKEFSLKR
jgi:hypothetical protein